MRHQGTTTTTAVGRVTSPPSLHIWEMDALPKSSDKLALPIAQEARIRCGTLGTRTMYFRSNG